MKTIYNLIGEVTCKLMGKRKQIKRVTAALLTVCIALSNLQGFSFVAWGAEDNRSSVATPGSAERATASNAVLIPEEGVGRGELLEEAARAVKSGHRFDLDSLIEFDDEADSEDALIYQNLFGEGAVFMLFSDNGDGGKFRNSKADKAYAYVFLRLSEEAYADYTEQGDENYYVTGEEELIFLYVNGTEDERQFSFNINGVTVPIVTLPGFSAGGGPAIATPSVPNASPSNAGSSNGRPSHETGTSAEEKKDSEAGTETGTEETTPSQEETDSPKESVATPSVAIRKAPTVALSQSRHLVSIVSSSLPTEGEIDDGDEIFPGYLADEENDEIYSYVASDGDPIELPQTEAQMKQEAAPKIRLLSFAASDESQANTAIGGTLMKLSAASPNASYHKKIQNLGDNRYRLYLDIAGGTQKGLDLVLVLDTSGSMGSGYGNGIQTLKNVLTGTGNSTGFIQNFLQNEKNELSIVTFSSQAKAMTFSGDEWVTSEKKDTVVSKVKNLSATGGTNYEDALYATQELLKEKVDDGKDKYVVFLSDGAPTYHNAGKYNTTQSFEKYTGSNLAGSGNKTSDNTKKGTNYAITAFKNNNAKNSKATIYTVGFTTSSAFEASYLESLASNTDCYMTADNKYSDSLQSAFDKISTKLALEAVKVEDTLSDNVKFAENTNTEVYRTDTNGNKTILSGVNPTITDKSIEAVFGNLDLGSVYTLAFDIELTEEAIKKYNASKGYDDFTEAEKGTGDLETNYDTNTHSANEFGLWTNKAASVTYTFDGGRVTEQYQMPVAKVNSTFDGPEYYKKILDNGDGTYDLELSVTPYNSRSSSTEVKKIPVDVVFVVDNSASMSDPMNRYNDRSLRKNVLNNILYNGFVNNNERVDGIIQQMLKKSEDGEQIYDIKIAGCRYGTVLETVVEFTTEFDDTKKFKCDPPKSNATNCAAGLKKGISLINSGRPDAVKYLIFMTDGEPNRPEYDWYYNPYTPAGSAYKEMKKLNPDTHFYAVRISADGGESFLKAFITDKDKYDPSPNGSSNYIDGSDTGKLQEEFSGILDNIIQTTTNTKAITNVKITDALSQYADMVGTEDKVEFRINGSVATEEQKQEAISKVKYDKETKQLTVEFKPDYKLDDDTTYSIRFKIRPSETAYKEYAEKGYNAEGDPDTDIDIFKITSSGKPGFRTNKSAKLEYLYNGKADTKEYLHPVLQVKEANLSYEKLIRDNRDGTYDLTLDVTPHDAQTSAGLSGTQITDKLSEYVEFVGVPADVTLEVNGIPATDTEKAKILSSVSYNKEIHTVTAKFNLGYTLEDGTTYTIRFKIKPSETAYKEYNANYTKGENPYGTTLGDEGTDAPGNNTSSGEPGFYSNDEATLTYTYAGVNGEKTYLKPVVQVAIAKVRFVKYVDSKDSGETEEFIIKMEGEMAKDGNYAVVLPQEIRSAPIEFYMTDEDKKFKVYEVVPKEYSFKDITVMDTNTEEKLNDRYTDGTLTIKRSDDITVVVTNTYNHKPYFHSRRSVTNSTTGDRKEPFEGQSQTPPIRPVAEAVSYDKNKIRNLEEDEPLAK